MAMTPDELITKIKSDSPDTRTEAWLAAGEVGAPAIKPLASLVATGDLEVGRTAKRAMVKIVHTAGAPDAPAQQRQQVERELAALLGDGQPASVGREVLWMISELCGGKGSIPDKVAGLLRNQELREDARCCLERIPGDKSLAALKAALKTVPDDFKINIAQSLRARGVEVSEEKYPCQKLVPTKKTAVEPVK